MTSAPGSSSLTPLMRQYQAVKAQHPDKIVFFRMGDFYEMFGEDAVKAAPMLGIALTSRSHGTAEKIPLAGVPYHAVDRYLSRLLTRGEKVVVVEQVEDPRTAKGIVKREIVEIVTPGTAMIDLPEESAAPRSLAAFVPGERGECGVARLDLTTGEFVLDEGQTAPMLERLRTWEPAELLAPESVGRQKVADLFGSSRSSTVITPVEDWQVDAATARRDLNQLFGTATLDSFGVDHCALGIAAAGLIHRYLRQMHRAQLAHITRLTRLDDQTYMTLDYSTVRNLELVRNLSGGEDLSLLATINRCHTAAGTRRLRMNLLRPFKTLEPIQRRQEAVAELVAQHRLRADIRELTRTLPDLERLVGRLGVRKLSPRQMAAIRDALTTASKIRGALSAVQAPHLQRLRDGLPVNTDIADRIDQALTDDPPLTAQKGGLFKRGYSSRLDQLNDSIRDARHYIASLQSVERERTGIATLKVGFNQVFGYYIEITRANAALAPAHYIRKQTLVNAERYVTPELKDKEELILEAEDKINRLELELYEELLNWLEQQIPLMALAADLLAETDVIVALAELAVTERFCRPDLTDSLELSIRNGRHPVIESVLAPGTFVANDTHLDAEQARIVILTGPNMSGKSTYLRQIGLIVLLAQIGSFVPADEATIGLVDRVFTRVGALDNLARGQSTFLVEMVETANILHNASERSLVLLDEVGRGTSTFDGLSVAWSVVEYLAEKSRARTVFATHYHELTGAASLLPGVANFQVAVKKWEDQVLFLHRIVPGGCDDSYGIEVARLAGIPRSVVSRARQILRLLESGKFAQSELGKGIYKQKVQTTLFEPAGSALEEELKSLNVETLTPLAAFELIRRWKTDLS